LTPNSSIYLGGSLRYAPLISLLLTMAWGQASQVPSNVPSIAPENNDDDRLVPATAAKVAPDTPVLTITGLCDQAPPSGAVVPRPTCQTVITRAQFERLTDAILTNMNVSTKRDLAESYPNLLAMAHEAEARGLENSLRFQERLAFARVQILSQELIRQVDEESAQVSENDIEVYYHAHITLFERASMERIFIPNRKRMDPLPKEQATSGALNAQRKEAEDAMTLVAEQLRTRAAGGEDFVKLQKEAYRAAGEGGVPPNPSLGQLRRAGLPPAQAAAFDLKPGEISRVLSDSTGHYIYKLDAKEIEPLEQMREEIRKMLQNQHRQQAIQAMQEPIVTKINELYFGPSPKHHGREVPKSK
jgi:PPIC-type PPIASE domain